MIRCFSVKNYLSISDRQELDFTAKGPSSALVSEVADGVFLYKLGVLYGANASGKSNMLLAMNDVFRILVQPKNDAIQAISCYIPFSLTADEPTKMAVSFYVGKVRYDYAVIYNRSSILKEELYYYPKGNKSLFYERTFVGDGVQAEVKFGASLRLQVKTQDSIRENTLNNHSVLSVCIKNTFKEDIKPFTALHSYLMTRFHDVDGTADGAKGIVEIMKEAYSDKTKRRFFEQMLEKADLNIVGFRPVVEDRIVPAAYREHIKNESIPDNIKEELLKPTVESIVFEHKTDSTTFDVPLKMQSRGTQKYIRILNTLYDLISSNHVYYLDELGEDLHYDLLFYYLSVFLFNSENSQLIITSQETAMLSQDLINENRGAVWFVEKNHNTASSEYSRGDSFGLHKNLSLYNSYKSGRLGAKPELGSMFIDLED